MIPELENSCTIASVGINAKAAPFTLERLFILASLMFFLSADWMNTLLIATTIRIKPGLYNNVRDESSPSTPNILYSDKSIAFKKNVLIGIMRA